jgi:DNA-binding MarR family transcriptional regulator
MKKVQKIATPQHELTKKEREFFEVLKDMTKKRGGKRPANVELAEEMGLDPGRVSNLLKAISLKGYYAVEETVRFA